MTCPSGDRVAFDLSTARWLASRKPAVSWSDAEPDTSERTPMSVASVALVILAQTVAVIGPVTSVSRSSGAVVYVSAVASNDELSVAQEDNGTSPAVHCSESRLHGL